MAPDHDSGLPPRPAFQIRLASGTPIKSPTPASTRVSSGQRALPSGNKHSGEEAVSSGGRFFSHRRTAHTTSNHVSTTPGTDTAIARLNALLDDPANDARPFPELRAEAEKHSRDTYLRPRLTEAALKNYPLDPADDPGLLRCEPWGLARQMFAPHQIEIRRLGEDRVELRYGEWNARRTVDMDGQARHERVRPSPMGNSVGRWEGETLVVETTGVSANITPWRFEHSDGLQTVERFTRSDDGDTLLLTATLTDPSSLRHPLVIKKIWKWAPSWATTTA